eukprot:ANDGO_06952.mRNA.1 hypothetical protein CAOG_07416
MRVSSMSFSASVACVAVVVVCAAALCGAQGSPPCTYTTTTASATYNWDFSVLKSADGLGTTLYTRSVKPTDPAKYDLTLEVCGTLAASAQCPNGKTTSATQRNATVAQGALCKSLGAYDQDAVIMLLDPINPTLGLTIEYDHGDTYNSAPCTNRSRHTLVRLHCDCYAPNTLFSGSVFFESESTCGPYVFATRSQAACPIGFCNFNPVTPTAQPEWCQFTAADGNRYDLNTIAYTDGRAYQVPDVPAAPRMDYRLNPCGYVKSGCSFMNETVAQFPVGVVGGQCKDCGTHSGDTRLSQLDPTNAMAGVSMRIVHGDPYNTLPGCSGVERSSRINITCDCSGSSMLDNLKFAGELKAECGPYEFTASSAAACPIEACSQPPVVNPAWCRTTLGGSYYDLNAVATANYYEIRNGTDPSQPSKQFKYRLNPCGIIKDGCGIYAETVAQLAIATGGQCKKCGTHSAMTNFTLLDTSNSNAGISMHIYNGDQYNTLVGCHGIPRTSQIDFKCDCDASVDLSGRIQFIDEYESNCGPYHFVVSSLAGCPAGFCVGHGSDNGGSAKKGLSGGWIFIIILVVVSAVYFGGGFLFKTFAKGTRGVESCPNHEFWGSIYGLVMEGFVFLINGCKPKSTAAYGTFDSGASAAPAAQTAPQSGASGGYGSL